MRRSFTLCFTLLLLISAASNSASAEHKYLKAFPAAEKGMTRFVIELPHKERGDDNNYKVELFVGKEMEVDGVNQVRLGGKIEAKPLKGWGFTYYELRKFGPAASTLIGVRPGPAPIKQVVNVPPLTIRYNSRIPVVVYVPKGGEVNYRIWKADEKLTKAKAG